jgi:hypothetical protein
MGIVFVDYFYDLIDGDKGILKGNPFKVSNIYEGF